MTRSNCQHLLDHGKKEESSRKTSISALLTMPKSLIVWITTNCGKFWKRWEYQTTILVSWETCIQVKKQQLKPDMQQQPGSQTGKWVWQGIILSPAYLNSGRVHHVKSWAGIISARRNINNLRYADYTILKSQSEEELKTLMRVNYKIEKVGLKLNIQKTKITHLVPSVHGK